MFFHQEAGVLDIETEAPQVTIAAPCPSGSADFAGCVLSGPRVPIGWRSTTALCASTCLREVEQDLLPDHIAEVYIQDCHRNLSTANMTRLCEAAFPITLRFSSVKSLQASVSRAARRLGFDRSDFLRQLVRRSQALALAEGLVRQSDICHRVVALLAEHELKVATVGTVLRNCGLRTRSHGAADKQLKQFQALVRLGWSFEYAQSVVKAKKHTLVRARTWFVEEHGGDRRETTISERRLHHYINLKDATRDPATGPCRVAGLWTFIGYAFADGHVSERSVVLVQSEEDAAFLEKACLPLLVRPGSTPPKLIRQHATGHATSYKGSRPVLRAHIEDGNMAAFLAELGMPAQKTNEDFQLHALIKGLPDAHFFSFLAGLFAGDGSISTTGKTLYLTYDLHGKGICAALAVEIERRTGVPMSLDRYRLDSGKTHWVLRASTTWRALALLFTMFFHGPFHLQRKVVHADAVLGRVASSTKWYQSFPYRPSDFAEKRLGRDALARAVELLSGRAHRLRV